MIDVPFHDYVALRQQVDGLSELVGVVYISPDDDWECVKCGTCCKDLRCKHLKNGLCSIHDTRPWACKMHPYNNVHTVDGVTVFFKNKSTCKGWDKGRTISKEDYDSFIECAKWYVSMKQQAETDEEAKKRLLHEVYRMEVIKDGINR